MKNLIALLSLAVVLLSFAVVVQRSDLKSKDKVIQQLQLNVESEIHPPWKLPRPRV